MGTASSFGGAGRWAAMPLLLVLVLLETTDVVFAVDSIPAVFGVTRDPLIVYTSNVFAILGLRSLYFALAGVIGRIHFLKLRLSAILAFVGAKMVLAEVYHVPIRASLAVIAGGAGSGGGGVAPVPAPRRAQRWSTIRWVPGRRRSSCRSRVTHRGGLVPSTGRVCDR